MEQTKTGEVLYARVPAGTKKLIAAVRGRERESDWLRRIVLEAVASSSQEEGKAK